MKEEEEQQQQQDLFYTHTHTLRYANRSISFGLLDVSHVITQFIFQKIRKKK